jgi:hypothetical protein
MLFHAQKWPLNRPSLILFFRFAMGVFFSLFLVHNLGCSKGNYVGPESADYLATAAQDDCGYIQNEFGQRVSWKSRVPVEFFISKTIPEEFHQDIVEAAEDWNRSAGKVVIKINLSQLDTIQFSSQDLKNSIVGLSEWDDSKNTQQALTIVKYRGSSISEADIKVNMKDFVYYSKDPQNSKQIHFGSLLVHELGHGLGLKHGLIKPTVMWSTLSSSLVRTKLSTSDLKSLECEY